MQKKYTKIILSVAINIKYVIYCDLAGVSDEHLDVVQYKDSTVDNDKLDSCMHQEHFHIDNKFGIMVDIVQEDQVDYVEGLCYQLVLSKDKVRSR
jgi:hypothetical protein